MVLAPVEGAPGQAVRQDDTAPDFSSRARKMLRSIREEIPMKSCFNRAAVFTALAFSAASHAQVVKGPGDYPNKPVRLVVPFVPGGPTDIQGRMLAEKMSQRFGQQVIVDNRGGANGNI